VPEPFYFFSELHLVRLLGVKAKNPCELLEHVKQVPPAAIYYHTHRFLQQHHYLSPEPPNDFAYWVTNILGLEALGESLASVDIVRFATIDELRNEFIRILSDYIAKGKYCFDCETGEEFHFMSCITVVIPTPYVAHTLQEFLEIIPKLSIYSLYFHVFEARMRLRNAENDFSRWFRDSGQIKLAEELSRLDPYTITLEGLREKIIKAVSKYV
jgi:septum formation topological specificity factor MinE